MLFTDLVGSTELASTLDPEDWREILSDYQGLVASIIGDHGGFVSQFQGDGALAFFGYPHRIETAGQDSVRAALAVVQATPQVGRGVLDRVGGGGLRARAGIHTGVVVVATNRLGSGEPTVDVFGEVPNLAARLQAAAGPGEVLVSSATASLTAGFFELQPLPPLRLKGLNRPFAACRVLGPGSARNRLEASPLIEFVARTRELAWLEDQWKAAAAGPARCVVLTGEPGIGKSRLVLEFARRAERGRGAVAIVYCTENDSLSPLKPFGSVMGAVPESPEAAVAWVGEQAAERTVMLVVDDAHWADPSTMEVVGSLCQHDLPLLIVVTARPRSAGRPELGLAEAHRLSLDRLARPDALNLVRRVAKGTDLPREVTDVLVERADGVPFYLEELTRSMLGQGLNPTAIPATVTEVITARLDRLAGAKGVAQLAAVIGREFDESVLAEISGVEPADLAGHLQVLIEQAVVERPPVPGRSLWFRHALIHEAAYQSLLRADRRAAHGRVADSLASTPRAKTQPQLIAHHLGAAGRHREATDMWRQASRLARRNSRFREAAGHEREILQLLPQFPPAERDTIEMQARRRLAIYLTTVDQSTPEAVTEAERALELANRSGDEAAVLEIHLVLIPWWQAQADYASIQRALPGAIRLAARAADKWFLMVLTLFEATMHVWQGRPAEGMGGLSEGWSKAGLPIDQSLRDAPPTSGLQVLVLASLRIASALACWLAGNAEQAWTLAEDTLNFARERQVPAAQAVTSATAAILAQLDGDRPRAALFARAAEELPDEVAILMWRRWAAVLRWWAGDREDRPSPPGPMLRPYFEMLLASDDDLPAERAIESLDWAHATLTRSGERFCEAEVLRSRARQWVRANALGRAAQDLAAAEETAASQQARVFELRALTDRFRLLGDRAALPGIRRVLSAIEATGPATDIETARRILREADQTGL